MRPKTLLAFICSLQLALVACHKRDSTSQTTVQAIDACELIKKEEIQTVQGSLITDSKSSANTDGTFRVSQCFYAAAEPNKSVSFVVTQRDPASASTRSPKDYWKETFGPYEGELEKEGDRKKKEGLKEQVGGEREEEAAPPKKIEGVGDDAFWIGSRVGGALYVIKKDVFLRISVGGRDNEAGRIDKSKALAQKAIERL
jgi:hypothetical protein